MRKIIVSEFMTLDNVIEDPGGSDKDNFEFGGWSWDYHNAEIEKFKYNELFSMDALLLGRITYEGFAKAWPTMKDTGDFGERMNNLPKIVVSKTLKTAGWNNTRIINNSLVEEILKLKNENGKDIMINGSSVLINELRKENLIDGYNLLVYPVVLGKGKKLFNSSVPENLKLIESANFDTGVLLLKYISSA